MRFDLTHAAYRVFDRALRIRLPNGLALIGAAKILIALFGEEETRAADWLAEAGLSVDAFRTAFGLVDETARLESPISAPTFPMGSYGISPGQPQSVEFGSPKPELSATSGDAPPRPANVPDRPIAADQWASSAMETQRQWATYSIHFDSSIESGDPNRSDSIHFFLDDQPVRVGRLSKEFEATLWTLLHRFGQRPSGEIRTMPNLRFGMASITLATEHLLLATALDEGEVGRWLRDNGLEPTDLFTKIETISGDKNQDVDFEEPTVTTSLVSLIEPRIFRLLDAVSNRALEALRVIEDYVRFVLDDRELTLRLKEFRHELRRLLQPFSDLSARDTEQDVGTELEGGGEYERRNMSDVLAANFGRLQESLRSLEEFSKLKTPQSAREFERLRYRSYTLHKEIFHLLSLGKRARGRAEPSLNSRRALLKTAKLYALTDTGPDEVGFREKIKTLIADGADIIQIRDKTANDRTLLERARTLRKQTWESEHGVLFVMNDRPDLAWLAEADGVHIGQEELSVQDVRRIVGDDMLIGVSTHDIEQARAAVRDDADYIGAGPVFSSATKEFETFPGLEFLREVVPEIRIPVFAIGGINADNLLQVLETGITRIAVAHAPLASLSRHSDFFQSRTGRGG